MPICADPAGTFPYVLESDRKAADPPTFQIRFLTDREIRKAYALIKDAANSLDDAKAEDEKLVELFNLGVGGWSGMKFRGAEVPYAPNTYPEFLSRIEKWELARACCYEQAVKEKELGESDSRQQSGPVPSAAPAAAGSATTSPAQ